MTGRLILALVAFGPLLGIVGYLHAAEPEGKSGNQILVCEPGRPCELLGKVLSGPTARSLDMADYAIKVPRATRITCVKVEGK